MKRKAPNPTGKGGFKKGQSGNPGGKSKALASLEAAAREHDEEALAVMVDIMRNSTSDQARLAAAEKVLMRGHGQPKQSMEVTGKAETPLTAVLNVTVATEKPKT